MRVGIGGHQRTIGRTDEWLTPPPIIDALGPFTLDPCSPITRPFDTATVHWTIEYDGLTPEHEWYGRVWLNPPYGPETGRWLKKLADHGNGIALIFARTETAFFHDHGWRRASAMLFLRGRLHFYSVNGYRAPHNGGAPSVLIAYGEKNAEKLAACGIEGAFVRLTNNSPCPPPTPNPAGSSPSGS